MSPIPLDHMEEQHVQLKDPFPVPKNQNNKQTPRKRQWDRALKANAKTKHADKHKSELNPTERQERKQAKKTGKSMMKYNDNYRPIVDEWNATDGITFSQASDYEKHKIANARGEFCSSQDAVNTYQNGN